MTTNPGTDPAQGAGTGTPPAHGATSTSQGDTSPPSIAELQRQLAELQSKNAEYLADNQKYRKERKEQEAAAQATEQQRLKEQGEYKKLAEQHEARAKELEPTAARFEALAAKIRKQIQTATKDWPAEIKAFYPGDDADVDQLQDWYDRSQTLLEKLQTQARATLPGNRPNPPAANRAGTQADADQRNRQSFVRQRSYGL